MKGDFTRSTFQAEKHYTSVRMQQGRLQLDSDWNEQVDIEAYLRHAQSVDMIGADSGVPTSGGDSGEPYRDSFKISITPDGSDLAIAPGRLYANGTFCELEATPFAGKFTASNRIQVNTLIVDGRQLEKDQWIEIKPDKNPGLKASVQIAEVNNQTLEIILNIEHKKIKDNVITVKEYTEKVENKSQGLRLRRVVTYNTQPDYIKPKELLETKDPLKNEDTIYLVYADVWQRHITAIEDPTIREVALNGSDTTTRTKTVWQIKLKKLDELINEVEVAGEARNELQTAFQDHKQLNNLNAPKWESLMQQVWGKFLTQQEQRQALMNACAKLCSSSGSQLNGSGYQRLENLLYRVEIYEPSQTEQGENQGNNGTNKATFKWSGDNGSIVSPIEKIEGNIITIRKSSQDAWMSSRTGQWLEITNEEMELKGQPGVMAPLSRAFDTKIEFNDSRIVNGSIPNHPTTVRLWSHDAKKYPNGAIPIADDWIELETGIKVKFYKDSVYRTGDYWLIPARNATNDIEWPHNQAELQKRQPLPQPPKGIHHDYCSLALIQFEGQLKGDEEKTEQEEQESQNIRDLRIIFPPLMRCLDKAGGIITGTLEIQSDLYLGGALKLTNNDQTATVSLQIDRTNSENWLQFTAPKLTGYSFDQQIKAQEGVVTNRIENYNNESLVLQTSNIDRIAIAHDTGNIGIGISLPVQQLVVVEKGKVGIGYNQSAQSATLAVNGKVGIGTANPDAQLHVVGTVHVETTQDAIALGLLHDKQSVNISFQDSRLKFIAKDLEGYSFDQNIWVEKTVITSAISAVSKKDLVLKTNDAERIKIDQNGHVGIGIGTDTNAKLNLAGALKLTNNDQTAAVSFQIDKTNSDNWVQFTATKLTGYSFDQQIKAQQGVITNRIENQINESLILEANSQNLILRTDNQDRITIDQDGKVGIGTPDFPSQLDINGTAKAIQLEGNSLKLKDLTVGQFSNSNLTDNEQSVPTEKAVKAYVDEEITDVKATLANKADSTDVEAEIKELRTELQNSFNKEITDVKATLADKADSTDVEAEIKELRTELQTSFNEEITDVKATLADKAAHNGDLQEDFYAKELFVNEKIWAKLVDTETINSQTVASVKLVSKDFYQVSSRTLKKEIDDLSSQEAATILRTLNPVKFIYTEDEEKTPHAGFIAEDTPDLLTANDKQAIKVVDIVAILTKVAQDHRKTLSDVVKIVKKQQAEIAALTQKIKEMQEKTDP